MATTTHKEPAMKTITATAAKRITRRKFGNTGRTIIIASKGETISLNVSDTHMTDGTMKRIFTIYPEGMTMGYALTTDEIIYDDADADANATSARQYHISL
jgi:hypothetical protein